MRPALLLALVLLAGCLDGSDASEPLDADAGADVPADAEPTPGAWAEDAFAMDGTTGTSLCLPNVEGGCSGPILLGADSLLILSSAGDAEVRATAVLTWDDLPTEYDDLAMHLVAYTSCGVDCYSMRFLAGAHGASPLTLDTDAFALEANETGFLLSVRDAAPLVASPVYGDAQAGRAFHIEGAVLLR